VRRGGKGQTFEANSLKKGELEGVKRRKGWVHLYKTRKEQTLRNPSRPQKRTQNAGLTRGGKHQEKKARERGRKRCKLAQNLFDESVQQPDPG